MERNEDTLNQELAYALSEYELALKCYSYEDFECKVLRDDISSIVLDSKTINPLLVSMRMQWLETNCR